MKKHLFFLLLVPSLMTSQDTLVLKDKSRIPSLVIQEVGDSIRFKKISYISGPDYYISKSQLSYIRYQNGVKENTDSIFKAELDAERKQTEAALSETKGEVYKKSEMYLKGVEDAKVSYHKPCGMAATGISTFFFKCSWSDPRYHNFCCAAKN